MPLPPVGTKIWRGDQAAIAQVNTVTVGGTPANGQVYTVTINGKGVSYTATGGDTNSTIASSLQTNLAASTIPEFVEVTWTVNGAVITGTAATKGMPFTNTSSATGTGTLVTATTTANSSPNDVNDAQNWSGGLPVAGDDVYITNSTVSLLWNLSSLSAIALNSLTIDQSFTGTIGLPEQSANGYYEYRPTYFAIQSSTVTVGKGPGNGSGRIKLDSGSATATTVNIQNPGQPLDSGRQSMLWKGTNPSNTIEIVKGSLGIAAFPGETATVSTLQIGYVSNVLGDVTVYCGTGCTITTITKSGGDLTTQSNLTTLVQYDGTTEHLAGTIGTLTIDGGTVYYQSTGTCTTCNVAGGGALDLTRDLRARTFTNTTAYKGSRVWDPFKTVTWTNPISCPDGTLADNQWNLGYGRNYQFS